MTLEWWLGQVVAFAAGAGTALLNSIWQGLLLAGAVGLAMRLVPRLGASARAMIWLGVFVTVVVLDMAWLPSASVGASVGAVRLGPEWALALAGVWSMISLVRLAQLAAGGLRLAGVARRAVWVGDGVWASAEVDRPGVFGFFAPRILLPTGLSKRLSPGELEAVLLHEREHLRRRDVWINLLQKVGVALLPLNPVLAWVERRMCRERELACDDHVLRQTGSRKAYAACLARLAEDRRTRRTMALALGLVGRGSELGRRIERILAAPETALGRRAAGACSAALLAILVGGSFELARGPRLVSFGVTDTAMHASAALPPVVERMDVSVREPVRVMEDRARMVRAVARLDGQPAPAVPRRAKAVLPKARRTQRSGRSVAITQAASAWMVMTRFAAEDDAAPALVPVRFVVPLGEVSGLSYATVPMGSGWLVIQL